MKYVYDRGYGVMKIENEFVKPSKKTANRVIHYHKVTTLFVKSCLLFLSVVFAYLFFSKMFVKLKNQEQECSWGDFLYKIDIRDDIVWLIFMDKSDAKKILRSFNTGASVYHRYNVHVISPRHLFFTSSDVGSYMYLASDQNITTFRAVDITCKLVSFVVYSGSRVDGNNIKDDHGSFYDQVTVLTFHEGHLHSRYDLNGLFPIGGAYDFTEVDGDVFYKGKLIGKSSNLDVD